MRRRHAILSLIAGIHARGDEASDILEAVEPLASALTEGRLSHFVAMLADDMPDRAKLIENVTGLVEFAEVTSSIVPTRVEKDRAELDWYMEIRARATSSVVERRRAKVTVRVTGKKIGELHPVDFFRTPSK